MLPFVFAVLGALGIVVIAWMYGETSALAALGAVLGFVVGRMLQGRSSVHDQRPGAGESAAARTGISDTHVETSAPARADQLSTSEEAPAAEQQSREPGWQASAVPADPVSGGADSAAAAQPRQGAASSSIFPPSRESGADEGSDVTARIMEKLRAGASWLVTGNWPAKLGTVVFLVGVALLLAYAAEQGYLTLPMEYRLGGVAAVAIVFLVLGIRFASAAKVDSEVEPEAAGTRRALGLSLQGGGIGILYAVAFTGVRLVDVFSANVALALMFVIALMAAALAVLQRSQWLAIAGVLGGFLAPVAAGGQAETAWPLVTYLLILAAGTQVLARWRDWHWPQILAMALTYGVGALAWHAVGGDTLPFIVLSVTTWALFAVAAFWLSLPGRQPQVALVYGNVVLALALLSRVLLGSWLTLGFICLGAALGYLLLWQLARRRNLPVAPDFLLLAVAMLTLAIPLALDGRWTAAAWAVEGAALTASGVARRIWLAALVGAGLVLLAGAVFIAYLPDRGEIPLANARTLGFLLLSAASLAAGWLWQRLGIEKKLFEFDLGRLAPALSLLLMFAGIFWWLLAGIDEIDYRLQRHIEAFAWLTFPAASVVLFAWLGRRLDWAHLARAALWITVLVAFTLLVQFLDQNNSLLLTTGCMLALVLLIGGLWLTRRWPDQPPQWQARVALLAVLVVAWQSGWWVDWLAGGVGYSSFAVATVGLVFLCAGLLAPRLPIRIGWLRQDRFNGRVPILSLVLLACWSVVTNLSVGGATDLIPWVPLLNPIDLLHLAGFGLLLPRFRRLWPVFAGVGLLWLMATAARMAHHWFNVPWEIEPMLISVIFQAVLSLVWGVAALVGMVLAARRSLRLLWLAGASLLGLVVLKLLIVDLAATGTVARIVSFLGVGALLLLVGYLAPAPPRQGTEPRMEAES